MVNFRYNTNSNNDSNNNNDHDEGRQAQIDDQGLIPTILHSLCDPGSVAESSLHN